MRRKTKIARWGTAAVAAALTPATAAACTSSPSSTPSKSASPSSSASRTLAGYPRAQTLYTSGTMYTPPTNWNPFNVGNYATGAQGLIYEPLFLAGTGHAPLPATAVDPPRLTEYEENHLVAEDAA